MNNPQEINEFTIQQLLGNDQIYVIPMYQRNYAWGEPEISQLIQDIKDCQNTDRPKYYIGTLVTFKRHDGNLEVIDGQQRFTTLSLLALYLKNREARNQSQTMRMGWYRQVNIHFDSRPKSTATFNAISHGIDLHQLNSNDYNESIVNGYALIAKELTKLKANELEKFAKYVWGNVQIMHVPVPDDTDLNHYFEAMNNRGEQLETHEVLKAKLMAVLNDIKDKEERANSINALQKVWEACANMERYVQYGFSPEERHQLFGKNDWGQFGIDTFDELVECLSVAANPIQSLSLLDIIDVPSTLGHSSPNAEEDTPERFNSVINFQNFLLHVLRIHTQEDVSLDDKQLLRQFEDWLDASDDKIFDVQDFVYSLLKCKFLFDQCIIKREFKSGADAWSLKRLQYYKKSKTVSFINRFDDNEDGYDGINRQILMLLSAFHVSTPTLAYKHWLNAALYFLFYEEEVSAPAYLDYLFNVAKRFVFDRFLAPEAQDYYDMIYCSDDDYAPKNLKSKHLNLEKLSYGNIENNFLFNYLDFLLWQNLKKDGDNAIKEYEFTFRSSVEHFYPQHPMEGQTILEDEVLHQFGNLCLISHSKNSRLSNFLPKAKADHFRAAIAQKRIDSLKLYAMIQKLDDDQAWGPKEIKEHGQEMFDLLLASTQSKFTVFQ